jgi:hypothetical protein
MRSDVKQVLILKITSDHPTNEDLSIIRMCVWMAPDNFPGQLSSKYFMLKLGY